MPATTQVASDLFSAEADSRPIGGASMNQGHRHIINASAHSIPIPDGSVHCTITSPPYYSLRKYAGQQEIDWPEVDYAPMPGLPPLAIEPMRCALGLEPTPEAYIGHLVLVFRDVWRVLRDDAVMWCVMGDSFGGGHGGNQTKSAKQKSNRGTQIEPRRGDSPGDLMLIPHRLALALQADGWLIRNDNVWAKKSPMPESVAGHRWERHRIKTQGCSAPNSGGVRTGDVTGWTANTHPETRTPAQYTDCPGCDRCAPNGGYVLRRGSWRHTRAHEFVFMLAKGMSYWSDQEKVREGLKPETVSHVERYAGTLSLKKGVDASRNDGDSMDYFGNPAGRNPRSVLSPRPSSYPGAHYAVFSPDLISPLIRATCPAKCCPVCGAGWSPVVEKSDPVDRPDNPNPALPYTADSGHTNATGATTLHKMVSSSVHGYRQSCDCAPALVRHIGGPRPGTVLDPFCGSGTTLAVAAELGVNGIGIDLSPEYLDEHAKPRIGLTPSHALDELPLFNLEATP